MSRFFYFGGCIIRGVTGFFLSQSAKQQPLPQGRGFVAKRVCARSNKRGGWAKHYPTFLLLLLWEFSNQKKRILGSEISHFRAMILLLSVYLLEKNFEVVSNTSGSGFLDSTAQSPVIRTSAISFSIQNGISFPNPAFHF